MESALLLSYICIALMALFPIYVASFIYVRKAQQGGKDKNTESLSKEDAYLFPVFGSAALLSLYLVFKFFEKEYINYLLSIYFAGAGTIAMTKTFSQTIVPFIKAKVDSYCILFTKNAKEIEKIEFNVFDMFFFLVSIALTAIYFFTKNWIVSNLLALSFSINAITLINLDSFKTGMILLSGLFVYDIFWVFGTPVMVSVATNFDAPIKVLFPRDIFTTEAFKFTMLGLGDIVIPGIFIALCLRFDLHMHYLRNGVVDAKGNKLKKDVKPSCIFPMPYFFTCFAFYILALVTTVFVMHTFKAAQPALLYISPACIIAVLLTGFLRNEISEVFDFCADSEEEKKEKEKKEKKAGKESGEINVDTKKSKQQEVARDELSDGEVSPVRKSRRRMVKKSAN